MEHESINIDIDEISGIFSKHSGELNLYDLPFEVLTRILKYFSFGKIAKLRLISKLFNEICGDLLNTEFYRLKAAVQLRYTYVKSQMPRRESSRRKHILARENDIVETLHMRLAFLNLTIGKHVERNHCCFFAGEILDEVNRLLNYVKKTQLLNQSFQITDELFDLSTMAVDYFKEHIKPTLPEVIYFTDFIGNSLTGLFKSSACNTAETNEVTEDQLVRLPTLSELNDCLENERRIVYRNEMSIGTIRSSIQSLNKSIDDLEGIVHQLKKEQNDWKEIRIPSKRLKVLLEQLSQFTIMIDSIKMKLPAIQKINKLSSINQIEYEHSSISDNLGNSYSSNCASRLQNVSHKTADNKHDHYKISNGSVASTSTLNNKRKHFKDISKKMSKKKKPLT